MDYNKLIAFHGHSCPGLAMGYRMTKAAMDFLAQFRAEDEELVAITENNACGVDALQYISGCTFGKGNLIFRDYGKQAYTLYSLKTGEGVRVVLNRQDIPAEKKADRQVYIRWLLEADDAQMLSLTRVQIREPEKARIMASVACDCCGEAVMESRIRVVNGRKMCIPCHEKMEKNV
ncbi:MAG: TraR/DksA C4-type zinc finger protein [Deltaproteobacteria bacterium]|nr:TraR/DksA C4-type zinc finger protein [Deltaproteobacteria bacterium]